MSNVLDLSNAPWTIVNDGVMGGRSEGRIEREGQALRFEGRLSLANNGGFSSARRPLGNAPAGAGGIRIEARGDGREYQLRLRPDEAFDGVAWRATFRPAEEWRTYTWRFDDFEPVYRGRRVADAGRIESGAVRQVGFLIADRQEGPFEMSVRRFEFLSPPD